MTRADTYLSDSELDAIQSLHRDAPYMIRGISRGMFSIARHYGGMTYQGRRYEYNPETDECVRSDVVKFVAKLRKAKPVESAKAEQDELPY
jgi:hypothetical protein